MKLSKGNIGRLKEESKKETQRKYGKLIQSLGINKPNFDFTDPSLQGVYLKMLAELNSIPGSNINKLYHGELIRKRDAIDADLYMQEIQDYKKLFNPKALGADVKVVTGKGSEDGIVRRNGNALAAEMVSNIFKQGSVKNALMLIATINQKARDSHNRRNGRYNINIVYYELFN